MHKCMIQDFIPIRKMICVGKTKNHCVNLTPTIDYSVQSEMLGKSVLLKRIKQESIDTMPLICSHSNVFSRFFFFELKLRCSNMSIAWKNDWNGMTFAEACVFSQFQFLMVNGWRSFIRNQMNGRNKGSDWIACIKLQNISIIVTTHTHARSSTKSD